MSTNILENFAAPTVDGIGQISFLVDNTFAHALVANMDDELVQEILTSGGMTGQKYRTMAFKKVAATMATELGNNFTARNNPTKVMKLTVVMVAIGSILGVTGSKKTLEKTIGATMEARTAKDDALDVAWRVIKQGFRTYVKETNTDQGLFPSLKFCSSCPEYALLGIMVLVEKTMSMDYLVTELQKPYIEWPEIFKKQWIGNFALSKEFQMEHMVWERMFWNSEVTTTNNSANNSFKRGFTPKYYETTIKDKFLVVLPNGQMVFPGETGYSKSAFAKLILFIFAKIKATKGNPYTLGGNIMSTNQNSNAVVPTQRFLEVSALPQITGLNNANKALIENIKETAPPTELTGSSDENVKGLIGSVNAITVSRPALMPAST